MRSALRCVLAVAAPGLDDVDAFPWERLRAEHTAAIRAAVVAKYAPRTANKIIAALRGVLKACWRQQLISDTDYHHAIDIKNARISDSAKVGRLITTSELGALYRAANTADVSPAQRAHDVALLTVLYYCGVRRVELCALDRRDYDPTNGGVLIRHGKGNKARTVYLPPKARARVEAWIAVLNDPIGSHAALFRYWGKRGMGGRLIKDMLGDWLAAIGAAAGVAPFTAHDFRRTFGTTLLDRGVDITTVRDLMGHENVNTTANYDRRGEEAKMRAAVILDDL